MQLPGWGLDDEGGEMTMMELMRRWMWSVELSLLGSLYKADHVQLDSRHLG